MTGLAPIACAIEVLLEPDGPADRRPEGSSASFWRAHIAEQLGVPLGEVSLRSRAGAAPVASVSGRELFISFSRTLGARACAVRRHGPVGVDVERVRALPELREMIPLALHAEEIARLGADPDDAGGFLESWTRKEAVLKAAGVGLRVDPRRVRLDRLVEGVGGAMLDGAAYETRVHRRGGLIVAFARPAD
ncbi:MAG: 4'-phosphopantetheinyl transferase superfamily protein [Phycisphaeraceae bacterium]|nr:MAG: 4'-phosphopantetheinyl transferase superfamily protein [Phycisphaeraceae bacterium]